MPGTPDSSPHRRRGEHRRHSRQQCPGASVGAGRAASVGAPARVRVGHLAAAGEGAFLPQRLGWRYADALRPRLMSMDSGQFPSLARRIKVDIGIQRTLEAIAQPAGNVMLAGHDDDFLPQLGELLQGDHQVAVVGSRSPSTRASPTCQAFRPLRGRRLLHKCSPPSSHHSPRDQQGAVAGPARPGPILRAARTRSSPAGAPATRLPALRGQTAAAITANVRCTTAIASCTGLTTPVTCHTNHLAVEQTARPFVGRNPHELVCRADEQGVDQEQGDVGAR